MRALVLLALRADEVHRGDDREQDTEREPVLPIDLVRPPDEDDTRNRQPDDDELERSRSRVQASGRPLRESAHGSDRSCPSAQSVVSPFRVTKRGALIPRTSDPVPRTRELVPRTSEYPS